MPAARQLRLGAFMRPVSIHTGAWRFPGAYPDANFNFTLIARFAQTLERANCTHPTQRSSDVEKMEAFRSDEIARLRFARQAKLLLGESNDVGLPGMPEPEENWELTITQQKGRLVFSLRDGKGSAGTLTFVLPKSLSVFIADTRDAEDKGLGPPLYTEWTLTSPFSGDGIFRAAAAQSRRLTLILQGRGSSCTDAATFTHWMLSFGPNRQFTFFGALAEPKS